MASLFAWDESFLTNLPSVDDQHQRLVGLINDLGELVVSARDVESPRVLVVLEELADYARIHFADEEALCERAGLDRRHVERHRAAHRAFAAEVGDRHPGPQATELDRVRDLTEYLVHWLAYHILETDQSMARQIRAVEGGASPSEAFEHEERTGHLGTQPLLAALSGLFYAVSERNRELRILNRELERRVADRTTEYEEANRRLQVIATQDELTGLPNRRFAMVLLARLWAERARYGGALSVIFLDADRFKAVNDRFGHSQGDALLRALADRLRGGVRDSDVVCRFGGDEFLVVCPRSGSQATAHAARRLLDASTPICTPGGVECWNGALSIGVAEADEHMARVEDLLAAADRALYAVKRRGGAGIAEASSA